MSFFKCIGDFLRISSVSFQKKKKKKKKTRGSPSQYRASSTSGRLLSDQMGRKLCPVCEVLPCALDEWEGHKLRFCCGRRVPAAYRPGGGIRITLQLSFGPEVEVVTVLSNRSGCRDQSITGFSYFFCVESLVISLLCLSSLIFSILLEYDNSINTCIYPGTSQPCLKVDSKSFRAGLRLQLSRGLISWNTIRDLEV
eukprot:g11566.t1